MNDKAFSYRGQIARLADAPVRETTAREWGDVRDGSVYYVDPELRLSVEIALAARRPLLLRGEPGSGKSSLASYIARNMKARYYEQVVTSRTAAEDLLWRFDAVRKLSDAQARARNDPPLNDYDYIEPGVLWWALNRKSAMLRAAKNTKSLKSKATEPFATTNKSRRADRATVLIDELDKADPDVPNGLLVPIGSSEFKIKETGDIIGPPENEAERVQELLIVITTNETRELPVAFVRRCVVHYLEHPDAEKLAKIAARHAKRWTPGPLKGDKDLFKAAADRLIALREDPERKDKRPPSTAEYLDAVRACRAMNVKFDSDEWRRLERIILLKEKKKKDKKDSAALRRR